jgi:hypothetical protein
MTKKILICLPALVALQLPAGAPSQKLPPQAALVRGVVVPVPREIFKALDLFAHSNWRAVQRPELAHWRPPGVPARNALLLGAVIAEGFVAVEAKDSGETNEVGRAIRKLARGLGIERAALRRSRSIIDHAESGDWTAVRREWDGVLPDVQRGMDQIRSEQLAQLVSLGGWLRGTEALSVLLTQDYSEKTARLLRQPALLDYFEKQLAGLSKEVRADPVVLRMAAGIRDVRKVLASGDGSVSRQEAKEISGLLAGLLKSLNR